VVSGNPASYFGPVFEYLQDGCPTFCFQSWTVSCLISTIWCQPSVLHFCANLPGESVLAKETKRMYDWCRSENLEQPPAMFRIAMDRNEAFIWKHRKLLKGLRKPNVFVSDKSHKIRCGQKFHGNTQNDYSWFPEIILSDISKSNPNVPREFWNMVNRRDEIEPVLHDASLPSPPSLWYVGVSLAETRTREIQYQKKWGLEQLLQGPNYTATLGGSSLQRGVGSSWGHPYSENDCSVRLPPNDQQSAWRIWR
jgi:hypothetical protein